MRSRGSVVRALVAALLPLAAASPAAALFHLAVISELLTSYGGDPAVQAVEIEMLTGLQTFPKNSVLAAFDETGQYVADVLVVPDNVANGGADVHWLMGTTAFETASGIQVDFEFTAGLPLTGGMVCWGAPDDTLAPPADPNSWDHTNPANYIDCVAYGSYSGPTNGFIGTPTPLVAEGHSLQRVSETHDNATDFACGDPADPENNAGTAASLIATVPCPIPPAVQTKEQQRCLVGLAKASAGLGGAQADELRFCTDAFTKEALTGPDAVATCAASDARVTRAAAKLTAAETKNCDPGELPDFAYRPASDATIAIANATNTLIDVLLGGDPDAALVSRDADARTAKCQVEVAKRLAARYAGVLKAAAKAQKRALATADTADALAAAVEAALLADPKLARADQIVAGSIGKRCQFVSVPDLPTRFPGSCSSAANALELGECVSDLGMCVACVTIQTTTGLLVDCDALDGEALYGNCVL